MPARTLAHLAAALGAVVALAAPAAAMLPVDPEPAAVAVLSPQLDVAPRQVLLTQAAEQPHATASLGSRVSAALSASTARTVSAAVDVDGLGTVLRRDASHALPPASTQKSFVATAALLAVGADTRMRTEVAATGTATAGVLAGPLYLVAGGDPYLTKAGLQAMAKAVHDSGITVVQGLRLDDSRYDALRRNPGWKSSWVPGELGPLSAFALDRNASRRDSAYLRDPALPNAVVFRDLLQAEGVTVNGSVSRARRPASATTVAERVSGPLSAVTSRLLKASDNFAAELLLKEVGRVVRGEGSSKAGLAAVKSVLSEQGVPFGAGADGSGLSSVDRQTTSSQVLLLGAAARSSVAAQLRAGLPVACVDGTLKKRMCGTAGAGNITAKTGTLSGVTALSGYATTRSGRAVRFSFQLTGVQNSTKARAAIDKACVLLASATE
ncbi:MAG: D-alanyl-D-alanine carboxypeptidase/D-alanyl-D-alanine-endopeptidase [Frankiales bacterium]|nr:D-alanyl-D-alanine carboxypeptidase/D-alanyl-D-alanine-endopeptidase [Frankiales bacterium]